MYSQEIQKFNHKQKLQKRYLLITTKNIYNIRLKSLFSRIKIRAKIPISELEKIIYSKWSKEFTLSFPRVHDLHYISEKRDQILEFIFLARSIFCELNNNLEFFFVDKKRLNAYSRYTKRSSNLQKTPNEEGMIINKEEFAVHFLGKQNHKNLIETNSESKQVNLADFEVKQMLAIGGFSKVYLVKKKTTNELYAMKSVRLSNERHKKKKRRSIKDKDQVKNERDILVKLKHPFIVKLKYAFQIKKRFFFVMPFIQGGELLSYMKGDRKRKEKLTRFYAAQIAMAMNYLHSQGIVYGDLRPENILIDKYGYIKLTDFGASKLLNGSQSVMGFAGTPDYLAPEVLRNKSVTKASDWWTFGILVFEMLFGKSPFLEKNYKQMFRRILSKNPIYPKNNYSKEAIDFINSLLRKRPSQRLGFVKEEEIFNHPWFKNIDFPTLFSKKLPAMIIPNIEEESSVEHFSSTITNEKLNLSFESWQDEDERKLKRKDSLDETMDGFNYEEKGFVETAIQQDEEDEILQTPASAKRIAAEKIYSPISTKSS